jgi:hypothetical protein
LSGLLSEGNINEEDGQQKKSHREDLWLSDQQTLTRTGSQAEAAGYGVAGVWLLCSYSQ